MIPVAEQTVDACCQELKERITFVKQTETIKGEKQAEYNQSIMQILAETFIPKWTRMRFRLLEQEKDFVIEVYDSQGEQEMKPVVIRFKYEFDWGVESWEEALMLCNEDRHKLYDKWKSCGLSYSIIANHFGLKSGVTVYYWSKNIPVMDSLARQREEWSKTAGPIVARIRRILEENGITRIDLDVFKDAYYQITGDMVGTTVDTFNIKTVSSDVPKCLNIAILYTENLIKKVKEINTLTYTNRTVGTFLNCLVRSVGIKIQRKHARDPITRKLKHIINHNDLEKCISIYNKVLNNLNQKRKELEAA